MNSNFFFTLTTSRAAFLARCLLAVFSKFFFDSQTVTLPPRIDGHFSDAGNGKITFEWNPGKVFNFPVKATLLRSFFPGPVVNAPVSLFFFHATATTLSLFQKRWRFTGLSLLSLSLKLIFSPTIFYRNFTLLFAPQTTLPFIFTSG